MSLLILRHRDCGHAIGMANLIGRNLLENKRMTLALSGHHGWEIAEASQEETVEALVMPWLPCGTCFRHDLTGGPHLLMGGRPA